MSTTQAVPQVKDTAIAGDLYIEFGARRQVLERDGERWPPRLGPIQRGRRRHGRSCGLHPQGPGALQARAAGPGPDRWGHAISALACA